LEILILTNPPGGIVTRVRVIELGKVERTVLRNKVLIRARNDLDFEKNDPTGLIVLNEKGERVAKVLDVIGNIESPYVLAMPLVESQVSGKVYLEVIEKPQRARRSRRK